MSIFLKSAGRENRWEIASMAFYFGLVLLVFATASQYGESYDEDIRFREGEKKFSYYKHLFSANFEAAKAISSQRDKYPGFHDLNLAILRRLSPLSDRITGNLFAATFGLLAILGAGHLARQLGAPRTAFITMVLLATIPSFYGHLCINPKDIPFACGYVWGLNYIINWFRGNGIPTWRLSAITGIMIGITIATRIGGLVLYCYLGLFVLLYACWQLATVAYTDEVKIPDLLWSLSLRLGLAGIIAMSILLIYWPYGQMAPFTNTRETIEVVSSFSWDMPVYFEGQFYRAHEVPWYFILKMLLLKVPIITLLTFLWGAWTILDTSKKAISKTVSAIPFKMLFILFSVLFPLAYVIVRDSTLYNGIRHLLFILPPTCVLSAIAIDQLLDWLEQNRKKFLVPATAAFCLAISMTIVTMIRLHPYQYIYYNELAGGTNRASKNYETDYWCTVYKELGESFLQYLRSERPHFSKPEVVVNMEHATWLLAPFIKTDTSLPIRIVRSSPEADDYYISSTAWAADQFYAGIPIIRVQRYGVNLGVIKDRRFLSPAERKLVN